jgi:hypothetical protein
VEGYQGDRDKITALTPYKPDAHVTRAEATKIIIEALNRTGAIDTGNIPKVDPYYAPYLKIATDLKPYIKKQERITDAYVLTPEEAKNPEAPLTRAEFIAMAHRVLVAFDCTAVDDDGDGMPNYWELKNGFDPHDPKDALLDADDDGLTNLQEYRRGTDPHNPDTDGGGVKDGAELKLGLNPLNGEDDHNKANVVAKQLAPDELKDPRKDLNPGIYILQPDCITCPCPATLDHTADILPGDVIMAVVSSFSNSTIFSKSNEIPIELLPEEITINAEGVSDKTPQPLP